MTKNSFVNWFRTKKTVIKYTALISCHNDQLEIFTRCLLWHFSIKILYTQICTSRQMLIHTLIIVDKSEVNHSITCKTFAWLLKLYKKMILFWISTRWQVKRIPCINFYFKHRKKNLFKIQSINIIFHWKKAINM